MKRKIMYRDEDVIHLKDCEKCEFYRGMSETFVRCGQHKGIIVLHVTLPANELKGFKNGETILYCQKAKEEKRKRMTTIINENGTVIGHTCSCGHEWKWPMYVFAHYRDEIKFTCPKCQEQVMICEGEIHQIT